MGNIGGSIHRGGEFWVNRCAERFISKHSNTLQIWGRCEEGFIDFRIFALQCFYIFEMKCNITGLQARICFGRESFGGEIF